MRILRRIIRPREPQAPTPAPQFPDHLIRHARAQDRGDFQNRKPIKNMTKGYNKIHPSEKVLPDEYPVHWGYVYLVDGDPKVSPLGGGATVRDLKREFGCGEIRNCDLAARGLFE